MQSTQPQFCWPKLQWHTLHSRLWLFSRSLGQWNKVVMCVFIQNIMTLLSLLQYNICFDFHIDTSLKLCFRLYLFFFSLPKPVFKWHAVGVMFVNWCRAGPGLFTLFCRAASFIHSLELCPLSFEKKISPWKVQADVSSDWLQSPLDALVLISEQFVQICLHVWDT